MERKKKWLKKTIFMILNQTRRKKMDIMSFTRIISGNRKKNSFKTIAVIIMVAIINICQFGKKNENK